MVITEGREKERGREVGIKGIKYVFPTNFMFLHLFRVFLLLLLLFSERQLLLTQDKEMRRPFLKIATK